MAQHSPMQQVLGSVRRVFAECGCWMRRAQQRRELLQMDARMLRDIGLSESDLLREVSKVPWQP